MVNRLVLGTAQMGKHYGINNSTGKIGPAKAQQILKVAYDSGVKVLDTAATYGGVHNVIGNYHMNYPGNEFRVITKLFPGLNSDEILQEVKGYLTDLNVSKIDTLLFHSFKDYKKNIHALEIFDGLKEEGFIKNVGVSIYTNNEFMDVIADKRIDVIQLPFNVLDNISQRGILFKIAKEKNKSIHVRSAFLQGLIFKDLTENHPLVEQLRDSLNIVHEIAENAKLSIATLALRYCMQQTDIDCVVVGVDSVEQLNLNLEAIEKPLCEKTLHKIDRVKVKNQDLLNPKLWHKYV